jgi:hypothetical protein
MNFEIIMQSLLKLGEIGAAAALIGFFMWKRESGNERRSNEEREILKKEHEIESNRIDRREKGYMDIIENYSKALERNTDESKVFQAMAKNAFDYTRDDLKIMSKTLYEQLDTMRELKSSFQMICSKYGELKHDLDQKLNDK